MIVLDASAVVELLTNGPLADSLRRELAGRGGSFLVPHLLDVEVASASSDMAAGGVSLRACAFAGPDLGIAA